MGRYKEKLKRIHRKKMRKAKEAVMLFYKKEMAYEKLNALAKKFLAKRKRKESCLSAEFIVLFTFLLIFHSQFIPSGNH
jgi:hypothetical protein